MKPSFTLVVNRMDVLLYIPLIYINKCVCVRENIVEELAVGQNVEDAGPTARLSVIYTVGFGT